MKKHEIRNIVKRKYERIAKSGCCSSCGCTRQDKNQIAKSIGYSEQEIEAHPEANLGLGCGNPGALGEIKRGVVVLDLGSGAGFDAFIAAKKVGESGKVIGVDMTEGMIKRARKNAKEYGYSNVEFRHGRIEKLPVADASVDVIISNCVINLSPDKEAVFSEAYRVLRKGGKMLISDMALLKELTKEQRKDEDLIAGCVGGALLKDVYISLIRNSGFEVRIISEDKKINKRQYGGLPVESLRLVASK